MGKQRNLADPQVSSRLQTL